MRIDNFHMRGVGVSGRGCIGGLCPGWRGFSILGLIMSLFLVGFGVAAESEASYCCEKTVSGGWCVNDKESQCAAGYDSAPTSCETTSYCKLGTCYDSEEGLCMGNTPQRSCVDSGGTWSEKEPEAVAQCQLGCCIMADQASFVSLVRCKRLSTLFGIENDYRTDITNEVACIAEANAQDMGACVYEKDFDRLCEFTTRGECGAREEVTVTDDETNGTGDTLEVSSDKTFYKDYLCSAEELGTSCARQATTTCHQGDVFWLDSCGNRENVYSSDTTRSWNRGRVLDADGVCPGGDGSNKNCGNCDYMLGSRCAEFDGLIGGPSKGDYYCQKTECLDRGNNKRINGESWCVKDEDAGDGKDRVGSRYYREICVDGEVKVEACADFRNEVCIEDSIGTSGGSFSVAGCRVNRWQDCVAQEDEDDCLNGDQRDCKWMDSVVGMILGGSGESGVGDGESEVGFSNPSGDNAFDNPGDGDKTDTTETPGTVAPITGQSIFGGDDEGEAEAGTGTTSLVTNRPDGICVPNFPPGLKFWDDSARGICGQANARCVVQYEKGLLDGDDWDVKSGGECLEDAWAKSANEVCVALGDCGGYVNFNGESSDDGYKWIVDGEEKSF